VGREALHPRGPAGRQSGCPATGQSARAEEAVQSTDHSAREAATGQFVARAGGAMQSSGQSARDAATGQFVARAESAVQSSGQSARDAATGQFVARAESAVQSSGQSARDAATGQFVARAGTLSPEVGTQALGKTLTQDKYLYFNVYFNKPYRALPFGGRGPGTVAGIS